MAPLSPPWRAALSNSPRPRAGSRTAIWQDIHLLVRRPAGRSAGQRRLDPVCFPRLGDERRALLTDFRAGSGWIQASAISAPWDSPCLRSRSVGPPSVSTIRGLLAAFTLTNGTTVLSGDGPMVALSCRQSCGPTGSERSSWPSTSSPTPSVAGDGRSPAAPPKALQPPPKRSDQVATSASSILRNSTGGAAIRLPSLSRDRSAGTSLDGQL